MKHQKVTRSLPTRNSTDGHSASVKCSKYHLRLSERLNSTHVIPQNNKTRQLRGEERRGREGKKSSNGEVTRFRLKTRHLGSYSASPTAWMLVHPIGCCLPELHSNEPRRWEAASMHESSLLNPSSAAPQPSLPSTTAAPALQLSAVLTALPPPEVKWGDTAKGARTSVK